MALRHWRLEFFLKWQRSMNKELTKGLLLMLGAIAVVLGLFVVLSDNGPAKAACVARAFKSGIALSNIDEVCKLTSRGR
ncbi:MAG TPA: hypothetical protein VGP06_00580 [Janthinobacterium sp.]|jgi:hypothetical protein|nr:hypothetical protein [Janthinobacterium sp.]